MLQRCSLFVIVWAQEMVCVCGTRASEEKKKRSSVRLKCSLALDKFSLLVLLFLLPCVSPSLFLYPSITAPSLPIPPPAIYLSH